MDVTTVLRRQHAGIRRALIRAALPGPRRAGEFRHLVRLLAGHEAAEVALARELAPTRPHPGINGELGNKLAMPVFGPADRIRDAAARWRGGRRS